MTNAFPPEDISARFDNIDTRLEEIGDELDLLRTVQNANRRETRGIRKRLQGWSVPLGNWLTLHASIRKDYALLKEMLNAIAKP